MIMPGWAGKPSSVMGVAGFGVFVGNPGTTGVGESVGEGVSVGVRVTVGVWLGVGGSGVTDGVNVMDGVKVGVMLGVSVTVGNSKTGGSVDKGRGLNGTSGLEIIKNVPITSPMLASSMTTVIRSNKVVRPRERPRVGVGRAKLVGSDLVKTN